MSQLWVVIVAGHVVVAPSGNEFFGNHDKCVAEAAAVGGACVAMDKEPALHSQAHKAWEAVYCIPGVHYMMKSDESGGGCPD